MSLYLKLDELIHWVKIGLYIQYLAIMNFNQQNIERMHEESCKVRVIKTSISGDAGVESQFLEQDPFANQSTVAGACIFSDEDITVAGFPPNPWGTAFRPGACYGDRQSGAPKGCICWFYHWENCWVDGDEV